VRGLSRALLGERLYLRMRARLLAPERRRVPAHPWRRLRAVRARERHRSRPGRVSAVAPGPLIAFPLATLTISYHWISRMTSSCPNPCSHATSPLYWRCHLHDRAGGNIRMPTEKDRVGTDKRWSKPLSPLASR